MILDTTDNMSNTSDAARGERRQGPGAVPGVRRPRLRRGADWRHRLLVPAERHEPGDALRTLIITAQFFTTTTTSTTTPTTTTSTDNTTNNYDNNTYYYLNPGDALRSLHRDGRGRHGLRAGRGHLFLVSLFLFKVSLNFGDFSFHMHFIKLFLHL